MPSRPLPQHVDYFRKKAMKNAPRSSSRRSHAFSPLLWMGAAVLVLLFLRGVFFVLFQQEPNLEEEVSVVSGTYVKGQTVSLKWTLEPHLQVSLASHLLLTEDANFPFFYVKSTDFPLDQYTGEVEIEGTIANIYQSVPIILISHLSGQLLWASGSESMLEEVVDTAPGTYLSAAGIQLMPSFYEHFTLLNEGEGGTLRFADVADENAQEYVLSYFRCRPGVADQDCKHLEETFAQNSPRSLTTRHGVTYYKSQQVNTWFANNHQRWGLMISDVPESVITLLKDDLLLVNEKSLKDREKSIAPRLCQQEGQQMSTVKKVSYHLETEGLVAQFAGSSSDSELSCSVLVDLGISNQGKLLSMEVGKALKEAETQSGSNTATQQSGTLGASEASEGNQKIVAPLQRNPQVPQFPLNPEKALRYQSARGYVAILPSPNLSYTVSMTQENFGQAGLKCGNLIKVVKYADKELLESSPAVEIYECSAKSPLASLGEQFLVVESVGKTFVIKINDPAWISFAQQLSFTALEA